MRQMTPDAMMIAFTAQGAIIDRDVCSFHLMGKAVGLWQAIDVGNNADSEAIGRQRGFCRIRIA